MKEGGITMKKLLALILVGTMLSTMPVMAAKSPDASSVSGDSGGNKSETPVRRSKHLPYLRI